MWIPRLPNVACGFFFADRAEHGSPIWPVECESPSRGYSEAQALGPMGPRAGCARLNGYDGSDMYAAARGIWNANSTTLSFTWSVQVMPMSQ